MKREGGEERKNLARPTGRGFGKKKEKKRRGYNLVLARARGKKKDQEGSLVPSQAGTRHKRGQMLGEKRGREGGGVPFQGDKGEKKKRGDRGIRPPFPGDSRGGECGKKKRRRGDLGARFY